MLPGIYVHVPFCRRKCPYCDFYSVTRLDRTPAFVQTLLAEIQNAPDLAVAADTLYLGGGTPSLLTARQISTIVEAVSKRFRLDSTAEITIEVNPATVDEVWFKEVMLSGVNRFSIGVQSFNDRSLAFLGRLHDADQARRCIEAARKAGVRNFGLDLIYGLAGQSEADWLADLETATAYAPVHLSCYMLTYEPGTDMTARCRSGHIKPLDESQVAHLFQITQKKLSHAGYSQYEISNFSLDDRHRSRHNRKYWNGAPYIGFGPSAHSYRPPDTRFWNYRRLSSYLNAIDHGRSAMSDSEKLTGHQQMIEAVYLGLRQVSGIDVAVFESRFGINIYNDIKSLINDRSLDRWVTLAGGRCHLTPDGMRFADRLCSDLIGLLPEKQDIDR